MIVYTDKLHIPFQIDEADHESVMRYSWYLRGGYPSTAVGKRPAQRQLTIALFLLGRAPISSDGAAQEWDHINRNKLDNRRANLRAVTHRQNLQNVSVRQAKTVSRHRGVFRRGTRWIAAVSTWRSGRLYRRSFATEAEAVEAARQARLLLLPYSYEEEKV